MPAIGEDVPVEITVRADAEGVGSLTNVRFDPAALTVAPTHAAEIVESPALRGGGDLAGLTLEPGESRVLDAVIRPSGPGMFNLRSRVLADDVTGRPVDPAEDQRHVRVGALEVTVTADPSPVELRDGEEGTEPADVEVTVAVRNSLAVPVQDVEVRVQAPVAIGRSGGPVQLPVDPFTWLIDSGAGTGPGQPEGAVIPTIPPGGREEVTFTGRALADGTVRLQAVASGDVDGEAVDGTGQHLLQIVRDVLVAFESRTATVDRRGDQDWQRGGFSWRALGSLVNRSNEDTLLVRLVPQLSGNAFYAQPVPVGEAAPDQHWAVGIIRELAPRERIDLTAQVRTMASGGTRGTVAYDPDAWVLEEDGSREEVPRSRILVTQGSGRHTVHVDVSEIAPEATTGELLYTFGAGTVEGLSNFAQGIVALAALAADSVRLGLSPWEWPEAHRSTNDKVAGYFTHVYENLTPADRQAWDDDVVSAALLATGMSLTEVRGMVDTAVHGWFEQLSTAYYRGDSRAVARQLGALAGENPDLVIQALVAGYGICRLGLKQAGYATRALQGKQLAQAATLESRAAAGARALRAGDLLDYERHLRNIYGVDRVSHRILTDLSEKWNIVVALRRRGVGVIEKVRTGRYTLKPEAVKAKNVGDIDADWLGFTRSRADEVAIKEPPPRAELRAQVLERWETRWKEWYGKGADPVIGAGGKGGERATWLNYQANGTPYGKEYADINLADNFDRGFSLPADATNHVRRPTRIIEEVGADGRPQWVIEIEDPVRGWQGVSGDIDLMALIKPDGTPLSEETRLAIYRTLRHLGFQHPESMTWNNAAGRNAYFQEFSVHDPAAEALAAYHPDGTVRATYFDPGKSWFDPTGAVPAGQRYLRGVTTAIRAPEATPHDMEGVVPDEARVLYTGPKTMVIVRPGCGGPTAQGEIGAAATEATACPVQVSNDPDALVLRQRDDGSIERWTQAGGWQRFTWLGGPVAVLPQTSLSAGVRRGETVLPVNEFDDLDLVAGPHRCPLGPRPARQPAPYRQPPITPPRAVARAASLPVGER